MISMNDFKAEPEHLILAEQAAVERVLRSGWYVLGQEVKAFEAEWAACCGVGYTAGVGNGMDAIEIGLRALGIGEGDEVITTPMTAFATVLAIMRAGATPVLADINPDTALLDQKSVERCITPRTKALLIVHLYGHIRDMNQWLHFCNAHYLMLLEDCAQSHMAKWEGRAAGSFGRFGTFSFYPTKNLGAIGDAGAIVSDDEALIQKANMLRNYGQRIRYHHTELGMNSRMDEIQAALLRVRLGFLGEFTERRRLIAQRYYENISNPLVSMMVKPVAPENHVYHLFVLRSFERDKLAEYLRTNGIESFVHYPVPIHWQEPCAHMQRDPNGLKATEEHAAQCLSIPCHPQMREEDIKTVIDTINAFQ